MIFFRIRLHSPAALDRFAPVPRSGTNLAAAAGLFRNSLAFLLSSLVQHALTGLVHFPEEHDLPCSAAPRRDTVTTGLPPVVLRDGPAPVLPLARFRQGSQFMLKAAVITVMAGGFGTLCLSYALACVTVSSVLLNAVA